MPGFVNQTGICEYFKAADLFILPSRFETWGLVVNEAMIFDLPVIVSDQVGCREDLVLPGQTGDTFKNDQLESLVEVLDHLVCNRELIKEMGMNAGRHIRKYSTHNGAGGVLRAISVI